MVGDVGGRQQLPADVTRHLLLVADEVGAEAVPRGKGRRARLYGWGWSHRETRGVKKAAGKVVVGGGGSVGGDFYRALEGSLSGVDLTDVTVEVIRPEGIWREEEICFE